MISGISNSSSLQEPLTDHIQCMVAIEKFSNSGYSSHSLSPFISKSYTFSYSFFADHGNLFLNPQSHLFYKLHRAETLYPLPHYIPNTYNSAWHWFGSVQFSSVAQSCPALCVQSCLTLCDSMDCSTPGLPVHHQFPELTQTHVHCVRDTIQPSHPLLSPFPPAFSLFQHQGRFR